MHAQTNEACGEIVDAEVVDKKAQAIAVPARPPMSEDSSPAGMIAYAMRSNASIAELRELYAFKKEYEADEARKAYVAAMACFKSEPLTITKDKHVQFTTQKGVTEYDHATIGNVTTRICAALGKHGFSHRWNTEQHDGGRIVVTCIITHNRGHSESTTLKASPDDSGGKNNIQAIASAVTYLQRYTLLAATGMATSDQEDDDGAGSGPRNEPPQESGDDRDAQRRAVHDEALARHAESVAYIKDKLASGDLQDVANEWRMIPKDDQMALWLAPTKGGCFTTAERDTMKSKLPKVSA